MNVVLDTNALMMPFEYRINIDLELERLLGSPVVYVPSCVGGELERLAQKHWAAKAALQLMKKYKVVSVEKLGDDGVIEAGKCLNAYVVTADRGLIYRLIKENIGVISLSNNHLVIKYEKQHDRITS